MAPPPFAVARGVVRYLAVDAQGAKQTGARGIGGQLFFMGLKPTRQGSELPPQYTSQIGPLLDALSNVGG